MRPSCDHLQQTEGLYRKPGYALEVSCCCTQSLPDRSRVHPAERLQGVSWPEVVPAIEMRPKWRTDGTIRTAWCGVPREVADSLATAKPTLQSQQNEL